MSVSVRTGCVSRNVASVVRSWAVAECVSRARSHPRGRWQDMCVCIYMCVSHGCACVARGPGTSCRGGAPSPPLPSRVGPGLRLQREGWGPGGRRLRHVGLFVVSQVQRGAGGRRIRGGAGAAGRPGRWRGGPGAGGGREGPRGGRGRASGRSCGGRAAAAPGAAGRGLSPGGAATSAPGARPGSGPRDGAPSRCAREAPRTPGSPGTLPPSTPQLCAASWSAGTAVCVRKCTCVSVCLSASVCWVTALSLGVFWSLAPFGVCVCVSV